MDPTSRTLRARRLLAFIALVMLVTGVTTVALVHYEMRKFAIVEADDKAKILIEHNHAIQRYYTLVLRPNLMEITKPLRNKEFFDPVWMSATYAVREIGKIFGNQFGMADYTTKRAPSTPEVRKTRQMITNGPFSRLCKQILKSNTNPKSDISTASLLR